MQEAAYLMIEGKLSKEESGWDHNITFKGMPQWYSFLSVDSTPKIALSFNTRAFRRLPRLKLKQRESFSYDGQRVQEDLIMRESGC